MTDETEHRWTTIGWQAALILNKLKNARALREQPHDPVADSENNEGRESAANAEQASREFLVVA